MEDFTLFGLSDEVMKAIEELGFKTPTPIQQKAIPSLSSENRDFVGLAHTGTGKTAAFGIPLIENVDPSGRYIQAIIVGPTRELVKQIDEELKRLSKYKKQLKTVAVYGGAPISGQISQLKKSPHILIATPGRLIDLIERRIVVLKDVGTVVLDEADEMLNMGFKEDIDKILKSVGENRKIWLFSATFPKEIRKMSGTYMTNPLEHAVDSIKETNANIKHEFCLVKGRRKTEVLKRIMDSNQDLRGIVFCRTRRGTQSLADDLMALNYNVEALHGDMSQAQRERVMKRFRSYQVNVVVATDVAARGIDVSDLTHILHYDIPDDVSYYTHRSGRTGRAGKKGISLVFVPPSQKKRLMYFGKNLKIEFTETHVPNDEEIAFFRTQKWAHHIAQTKELDYVAPEIMAEMFKIFGNFSKEELVEKMLTSELRKLNYRKRTEEPRYEEREEKGDWNRPNRKKSRKDRNSSRRKEVSGSRRKDRASSGKKEFINFFINVGSYDGVGKRDLLTYLAEQTKLDINAFQNLELNKKHTFFDVHEKYEARIINSFRSVRIGDRKLRVNRNHT